MKKKFFTACTLGLALGMFCTSSATAQQSAGSGSNSNSDEIIIRKKGGKDEKLTVEFKDGQVTINGKPMSDYKDDDVSISRRRDLTERTVIGMPSSPFRGGTLNFNGNAMGNMRTTTRAYTSINVNRAILGVLTQAADGDQGARITSVTKSSAAEKAGLKEGDIITKIENTSVSNPEELTKAIGKYKPEDKVGITYKRDNKEQKTTVTLAKRDDATAMFPNGFNSPNFNFDYATPGPDGRFNFVMRSNGPRLGLQAQDTEDGKGVKVLNVEDASNAAKAGIKEGDVITEFNGKSVASTTDLMEAAKDMKDKNSIKVKLNRDGKNQEMEIRIPKRLKTATL